MGELRGFKVVAWSENHDDDLDSDRFVRKLVWCKTSASALTKSSWEEFDGKEELAKRKQRNLHLTTSIAELAEWKQDSTCEELRRLNLSSAEVCRAYTSHYSIGDFRIVTKSSTAITPGYVSLHFSDVSVPWTDHLRAVMPNWWVVEEAEVHPVARAHSEHVVVGKARSRSPRRRATSTSGEKASVSGTCMDECVSSRRCFMKDTLFLTPDAQLVPAEELANGSVVLDSQRVPVQVTWAQIHLGMACDVIELRTKRGKLVVTGSHRIPLDGERVTEASMVKKGDKVWVTKGAGKMQEAQVESVTKHGRKVDVVHLEFENDASVACFAAAFVMKGNDPCSRIPHGIQVKHEPGMEVDPEMSVAALLIQDSSSSNAGTVCSTVVYPNTDDGF